MARSATRPKLRRSTPRTSCCSFRGPRFSSRTVTEASGTIQHVSDTARWVALYRAMAAERPDALFHDPYARQVLVVSEGLLIYLTGEQVGALASDLAAQASFGWWLIDLASPGLLRMMARTWGRAVADNAPFRFAPPEGTQFFEPFGWREAEFRSTWEESLRLKRTLLLPWLWGLLGRLYPKRKREEFRRFSG